MAGVGLLDAPGKPWARREHNASHRNAISSFASPQIHSEVNLDMASLSQSGGPGLGVVCGAPTSAPQFLSESPPVGSCLRVSDFRLYCYFLKKKTTKKTPTQFFFKGFPCSNLHLEKQLKLFFSDWSGSAFKQWNKLGKPYVWSHRDMTRN